MKLGLLFAGVMVALFAITSPIQAQTSNSTVNSIVAQFPNGGAAMRQAIAQAIAANPSLAQAFGQASRTLNPAQQDAVGSGMADAAVQLSNSPTVAGRAAARQVLQAMTDSGVNGIVILAVQTQATVEQNIQQASGGGGTGGTTASENNTTGSQPQCTSQNADGTCNDATGTPAPT